MLNKINSSGFLINEDEIVNVGLLHKIQLPKLEVSHEHLYFLLKLFQIKFIHFLFEFVQINKFEKLDSFVIDAAIYVFRGV